jgi:putative ABC transport system ATP-binding protein
MTAIDIRALRFGYRPDRFVLDIEALQVQRGQRVFLHGPSGSGKSTLLALIGGVLRPQAGSISVCGENLAAMSAARRDALRADALGFVFQTFNLLPYLTVLDNVLLPARFSSARRLRAKRRAGSIQDEARRLLSALKIDANAPVAELSQGQQQRVAVARALFGQPSIVIADEPTSSLDSDARDGFIDLLLSECRQADIAVLFVSHDRSLAAHFDTSLSLPAINVPSAQAA